MFIALIFTALATGGLTVALAWPAFGAYGLLLAPFVASTAVAILAVLLSRRPATGTSDEWLDDVADRLVADLNRVGTREAKPSSSSDRRRRAG